MESLSVGDYISDATLRNWKKLKTMPKDRLTKRANKIQSKKHIFPLEYFCNKENLKTINQILDIADNEGYSVTSAILSLGINQLKQKGIFSSCYVQEVLSEYKNINIAPVLENIDLPDDEFDFLGLVYQSFLNEGKKNAIGSYYTPKNVAENMTQNLVFSEDKVFLDPCCGSGAFLLSCKAKNPKQLYGIDNDALAVMIARINLLLKYSDWEFKPNIYCCDFLEGNTFLNYCEVFNMQFDYIATNPPWGAITRCECEADKSEFKEPFSQFFVKSCEMLKESGSIRFLFPEAIMNVKSHKNIRNYILKNLHLVGITAYGSTFSGVVTKYVDIECDKCQKGNLFKYTDENGVRISSLSSVCESENLVFNFLGEADRNILHKVKEKGKYSLKNSVWALGIVTGDNKNKIFSEEKVGSEKIYTGKEITPYLLKNAENRIFYDRANWQQAAKEEIYRADEKLVYKFISKKLVFAYDNSKSLFLNSANILIPNIPNMSIKTVMAFLNSDLFQFLYIKMFGEVKILKGNLSQLPFPDISQEENLFLTDLVDNLLNGNLDKEKEIKTAICEFYNLTKEEIDYIGRVVNGKAN